MDSSQPAAAGPVRWWIAGFLLAATVLNYLDRQVLSVTAPVLRREFRMTATDYSMVVTAFLVAYTIMQGVAGRVVDRIGARRGMTCAIAWWSCAAALHALANSVLQLGIFRFLLGLGEAGNWPAAVKLISRWFPPKERAFAIGLFNSGSAIGAMVAPPLIAWLTLAYSWRAAFLVSGALGLLWLVPWAMMGRYKEPVQAGEGGNSPTAPWWTILRRREAWGLMLGRFCADPVWWFYVFWLPDYLSHARGLSLAAIGASAWAPFLGADLGNLAGGWLSGKLISRGIAPVRSRKIVMAASAILMVLGVTVTRVSSPYVAIALVSAATFAYSSWAANVLTLPADVFEQRILALGVGLPGTFAGIGGILTTLTIGRVVDAVGYSPVFAGAGLLPLLGLAAILWGVRSRGSKYNAVSL